MGSGSTFVFVVIFMATFITFILYFYELNCLLVLYYYVSLRAFMRFSCSQPTTKRQKKGKPLPTVTENQIARQFNDILSVPLRGKGKRGLEYQEQPS